MRLIGTVKEMDWCIRMITIRLVNLLMSLLNKDYFFMQPYFKLFKKNCTRQISKLIHKSKIFFLKNRLKVYNLQ